MKNNEIIISEYDFKVLTEMVRTYRAVDPELIKCRDLLFEKLRFAVVVNAKEVPQNLVQLNSIVTVFTSFGRKVGLKLVLPDEANFHERKLSIISTLGTALFGIKEGKKTQWHFPQGDEWITVEKVDNSELHILYPQF